MQFRFLHVADVHLGNQQYGLPERFADFHLAWRESVDRALAEKVDLFLIAGDLFEKRNTDPLAFEQAQKQLLRLEEAGIPVVAIEGNHDRYIHNREHSWMRVLASQNNLILLDAIDGSGRISYAPYDPKSQKGAYVDLPGGVRIIGLRYRGERLGKDLGILKKAIQDEGIGDAQFAILMVHTGVQKETEFPAGRGYVHLPRLDAMTPPVDYVATGHIHYAKVYGLCTHQPGSLENCSSEEAQRPHGFFLVDVDLDKEPRFEAKLIETQKRPFLLLSFGTDSYDDFEALEEAFAAFLQQQEVPESPCLLELSLEGILHFPRHQLNIRRLETLAREHFEPLHLRLRNKCAKPGELIVVETLQTREELEAQVLLEAFRDEVPSKELAETYARLALELKQHALKYARPEAILDILDRAIELKREEQGS